MIKKIITATLLALTAITLAAAQTESSYDVGGTDVFGPARPGSSNSLVGPTGGLLDPSRFTVNHAMSFMAGGPSVSSLKSQSVYSTMMQYRFNAPVVLALNFDMPLHSTFNDFNNLNQTNVESMDYFRNMPVDASVTWFPTDNFMMRVSVHTGQDPYSYYGHGYGYGYGSSLFRSRYFNRY